MSVPAHAVAHPFDAATAVALVGDSRWRTELDPAWFGSVAPHGGHLAAQVLRAVLAQAGDPELSARSLTLHFVSPGLPGDLDIDVRLERAGRNLSTLSARASQQGRTVALALAVLGRPRRGPALGDARPPEIPPPHELRDPSQQARAQLPPVTRHYEMRYGFGTPRSGAAPRTGGWVKPTLPRAADDLLTTALTDIWMPSVYVTLTDPILTTTAELTVNFHAPAAGLPADGWYRVAFHTPSAADGYFREEGEVWGQDGRLLAHCSQLAVFLGERRPRRFAPAPADVPRSVS